MQARVAGLSLTWPGRPCLPPPPKKKIHPGGGGRSQIRVSPPNDQPESGQTPAHMTQLKSSLQSDEVKSKRVRGPPAPLRTSERPTTRTSCLATVKMAPSQVGNGQQRKIAHAVKHTTDFSGNLIEIMAIIKPRMDDPLDLVVGSKLEFELEGLMNYQDVLAEVRKTTIPLHVHQQVPRTYEVANILLAMNQIPSYWTQSVALSKNFVPQLMSQHVKHLMT